MAGAAGPPGRRDHGSMSQFSPRRISPDRAAPRYAAWPLLAVPALGAALAALGAFAVFATAGFASVLFLGDGAGPGQLASDYVNAHFPTAYSAS